jgi:hypothetical protein
MARGELAPALLASTLMLGLEQLGGEPAYRVYPREVDDVLVHRRAAAAGARLLPGRPHARGVAAADAQLGAAAGQLDRGRLANPTCGSSEDDG